MTIEELRTYAKEMGLSEKRIDALISELHPDNSGKLTPIESMEAIAAINYIAETKDNIRAMLKSTREARYCRSLQDQQDAIAEQANQSGFLAKKHDPQRSVADILCEDIKAGKVDRIMFGSMQSEPVAIDYRTCYDLIMELQQELAAQHHDAEIGCIDYKVVKALAATYELQDYLASRIAQNLSQEVE